MVWVLDKAILMSTHNLCFYGEIWISTHKLSHNNHPIPSSVLQNIQNTQMKVSNIFVLIS